MSKSVNIVIADDHPIVRQGLRQIIENQPDLNVMGEASDGEKTLAIIKELKPDILILDIDMPKMDGLEVLRLMRQQNILCDVILLTFHKNEDFFNEAVELGAKGYVLKDGAVNEIVESIRTVANGQNYVSQSLTSFLFKKVWKKRESKSSDLEKLTPTEREILKLIAEYYTNNQIAEKLSISLLTVKTHRRNINQKLSIAGSHALMKFALENKSDL